MINLLPPDIRESVSYARRNTLLIRWLIAVAIGLAGVAVIVVAGQAYISQATKAYAKEIELTKQHLKDQKLEETQKQVSDLSSSLKLMVDVLSRQILFSDLIRQTGAAIPPGAVLTNLTISKVQGGIDLQFKATDYQTATQIQVNLEDPDNKIFDKADIVSISCSTEANTSNNDGSGGKYPCTVSIRALFTKNNPFLFISKQRPGDGS
ncbi:hypothetical protein BH23PAT1_BH23PAT1_0850 [soil metagenome]